ncbi:MAG: divergent polysaccharide deacetylase family protein [Alphaproteobacteria bacterium]|nr:divergent polysaccharide deacetylase family protein [Alphaproteobacteria bacterium]
MYGVDMPTGIRWLPFRPILASVTAVALLAGIYGISARHGGGLAARLAIPTGQEPPGQASALSPVKPAGETSEPKSESAAPGEVKGVERPVDATWARRAVPSLIAGGRPLVAVIVDDVGLDRPRGMRVISLPAPLTLSFLPYGRDAPALAVFARQRGHEVLLHMPMQPIGREDPGPQALTTDLDETEIRIRVGAALDRFGDAIGLNNHMGSRFTASRALMIPVMDELAARGLVFVDSRTNNSGEAVAAAGERAVPAVVRDVFIDHEIAPAAIAKQLEEVERIARRRGYAVAIGHPHDATIVALERWLPGLEDRGLHVVPISAVIRRSLQSGGAVR